MPNDPFYYISVTRLMERRRTAVDSLRTNDSNYHLAQAVAVNLLFEHQISRLLQIYEV
jgi:hypothetical protein